MLVIVDPERTFVMVKPQKLSIRRADPGNALNHILEECLDIDLVPKICVLHMLECQRIKMSGSFCLSRVKKVLSASIGSR